MLWGKLIDHDRCIGCHACSVACKSENQVPLGAFRTWVKQVDKGQGLAAKRHFGVLRCNQCERPPCVEICPTAAMHRRPDGIVDFDNSICVGCKACIQACPYDAIYIDPETDTAAKCNFCAHRIEVGLEPACVAACPTSALLVSDLEDAQSPVARAVSRTQVAVRKPEIGTRPKVFYKGADACVLDPRMAQPTDLGYWGASRTVDPDATEAPRSLPVAGAGAHVAVDPRVLGAPAAARVSYDVPRDGSPWGTKISLYLLTKAIAGGAMMIGGLALLVRPPEVLGLFAPLIALIGLALTMGLLVADLKRPDRFLLVLFKAQAKSWLVKGAWILTAAAALAAGWAAALQSASPEPVVLQGLGVGGIVLGAASAGYTALLFGQAKGRQFWQSPLLLPHLVVQAGLAGSAALALVPGTFDSLAAVLSFLRTGELPVADPLWAGRLLTLGGCMALFLFLNLLCVLGELWTHGNEDSRLAIRWMQSGERATTLYFGVFALGHVFPAVALAFAFIAPSAFVPGVGLAAIASIVGVYLWDDLYVRAGQAPPLS